MTALLTVETLRLKRSLGVFLLSIGMPVIFFLIFSSTVQLDDPESQRAFVQRYMLTMTSFSMSGFALFTFPMMLAEDRTNNWLSYIQHSPISLERYYLSKLFRVLLCFVSSILIVFLVGGLVRDVHMFAQAWLVSAVLLLVTSLVYLAFGLLLTLFSSQQTMSVISNFLYFALAILGGSWMPISVFPEWVQKISKVTPSYHVNQLVTAYADDGTFHGKSLLIVLLYAIIIVTLTLVLQKRLKGEGSR